MSLFEEQERGPVSVSELNSDIKSTLESRFPRVWVEGEITGFHAHSSGHWYFSLTDGSSFIKAACFKGQNFRIRYKPENGHNVRVRGRVSIYERRGEYQLIVESLEPVGEGALAVAFEQVKARLQAEGLFDESLKRPLPEFPKRVGVVTSPTGAAVHDILSVMERRARSVNVIIIPTLVQGDLAGEQIVRAIELANAYSGSAPDDGKIDVLIVGRGGGSAEDLWAFNEEQVARAIRGSAIPVISAVGHEVDFTIADFVADVRAATPSAAAEIVVKREDIVYERLVKAGERMGSLLERKLLRSRQRLSTAQSAPVFFSFPQTLKDRRSYITEVMRTSFEALRERIRELSKSNTALAHRLSPERLSAHVARRRSRLESLEARNAVASRKLLARSEERLRITVASLEALSPLAVLTRGFSLTRDTAGRIVRDASMLKPGDEVDVKLHKGRFGARVTETGE